MWSGSIVDENEYLLIVLQETFGGQRFLSNMGELA
jgi:hypothetical protein